MIYEPTEEDERIVQAALRGVSEANAPALRSINQRDLQSSRAALSRLQGEVRAVERSIWMRQRALNLLEERFG